MIMSLETRPCPAPVSVLRAVSIAASLLCLLSAAMPVNPQQHAQVDSVALLKAQLDAVSKLAQSASDPLDAPAVEAAEDAAHRSGNPPHHDSGMLRNHRSAVTPAQDMRQGTLWTLYICRF